MGKINWGRALAGGLLAGVVLNVWDFLINGVLLKDQWNAAMHTMGKPDMGGSQIMWFVICDLIIGFVLGWLYAAIRPRYGAGPKTAAIAGFGVWVIMFGLGLADLAMGSFPQNLFAVGTGAALVGVLISAQAGGWVYKEGM